jgi:hypothetical protein
VAGLHQQQRIGAHERRGHRDLRAVGEAEIVVGAEFLDAGEDVIPAPDVEARGMLAQLVQDLVHLERRNDRLDEGGGPDRPHGDPQFILRKNKNLVPQPRLEMRLHLRQVEVRARAAREQLACVVEEVEREVEDAARDRLAVDGDVLFIQVPAARARDQHRGLVVQPILLAVLPETDVAAHSIAQVDLPVDHVVPGRAIGVLEVGHEGRGAAIQRIDDHLAVGGTRDLDTPVEQVCGLRSDFPLRVTDLFRSLEKIRFGAGVELFLPSGAACQQLLAPRLEAPVQHGNESNRLGSKDLRELRRNPAGNRDAVGQRIGHVHSSILCSGMWRRNMKSWPDGSTLRFSPLKSLFHIVR